MLVKEDYSPDGTAWDFLPHNLARSHTYRWGEDGLLGMSDDQQQLCFALALWNEADPILRERLCGLTGALDHTVLGSLTRESYY